MKHGKLGRHKSSAKYTKRSRKYPAKRGYSKLRKVSKGKCFACKGTGKWKRKGKK